MIWINWTSVFIYSVLKCFLIFLFSQILIIFNMLLQFILCLTWSPSCKASWPVVVYLYNYLPAYLLTSLNYWSCYNKVWSDSFPELNHTLPSSCPAWWNSHQTAEATKWGWERCAGDPQPEEGARLPLRHHRRAVLAGTPRYPRGWWLLTASLLLWVEKHWTGVRSARLKRAHDVDEYQARYDSFCDFKAFDS